jgi:hypothetical protein
MCSLPQAFPRRGNAEGIAIAAGCHRVGVVKPLPGGSPGVLLWNPLQHTCCFLFQERI